MTERSKWTTRQLESGHDVHVIPCDDAGFPDARHVTSRDCRCEPILETPKGDAPARGYRGPCVVIHDPVTATVTLEPKP